MHTNLATAEYKPAFRPSISSCPWPLDKKHSADKYCRAHPESVQSELQQIVWPQQPVVFISDLHADVDALYASLKMVDAIESISGPTNDILLTDFGRQAVFVIGGDCLDKGPSNLALLRALKKMIDAGAQVELLAGNHDMRLWMGLRSLQLSKQVKTEHMFLRMGEKVIPLFKEIYDQYLLARRKDKQVLPSTEQCRQLFFPREDWFDSFASATANALSDAAIAKELKRMRRKRDNFEACCVQAGLDLQDVYLIARQCQLLFLDPQGEFAWFFKRMKLAFETGSILYLHAGVDDKIAQLLADKGVDELNQRFQSQLQQDLFTFYYGEVANVVRTKYRSSDLPLSHEGTTRVKQAGYNLIVHGHINRRRGQRVNQHQGLLHLEADVTLDRHSRKKEGLARFGAGATLIIPEKQIFAISNDFPYAKVLSS